MRRRVIAVLLVCAGVVLGSSLAASAAIIGVSTIGSNLASGLADEYVAFFKSLGYEAERVDGTDFSKYDVIVTTHATSQLAPYAQAFQQYLASGGNLLLPWDSAAWAGGAVLLPDVVQEAVRWQGLLHVKDGRHKPVAEHPVTKGLTLGTYYTSTFEEHTHLIPGPLAQVVFTDVFHYVTGVVAEVNGGKVSVLTVLPAYNGFGDFEKTWMKNSVEWFLE